MDDIDMRAEAEARAAIHCVACGAVKGHSGLVCWGCFRRDHGLKHSGLTLGAWIARELETGRVILSQTEG